MTIRILQGDCLDVLKTLHEESVHCVVCSPPYWGLRDYGVAGQLGLESTPQEYVEKMVAVFREVRRVLRDDGTLWLNLGDSYAANPGQRKTTDKVGAKQETNAGSNTTGSRSVESIAAKNLIGIPWRVAFALQADGWWLRQDIIWSKPNPMPESVRDRCTKSHEYLFLLAKSERYYFDAVAIAEESIYKKGEGGHQSFGKAGGKAEISYGAMVSGEKWDSDGTRNKRSVWTVTTQPFKEAHFATFPPALIEPCILAGCPEKCCAKCGAPWMRQIEVESRPNAPSCNGKYDGDGKHRTVSGGVSNDARHRTIGVSRPTCQCGAGVSAGVVLDCFGGAGTTGLVADRLGRNAILIELNESYCEMARKRISGDAPLLAEVE